MSTIDDLRALLVNKDAAYKALGDAIDKLRPAWQKADPQAFALLASQWEALKARYSTARTRAFNLLKSREGKIVLLPDALQSADDEFNAMKQADQAIAGTVSPGDYQDLYARVTAFSSRTTGAGVNVPVPIPIQQDVGSQFLANPLGLLGDAAARPFKDAANVTSAVEEKVAEAAKQAADAAKKAANAPTWKYVAAGAGIGVLGIFLLKRAL